MGLDGAKIIDGDLANDIYNDFMSLYFDNISKTYTCTNKEGLVTLQNG